MTSIAPAVAAPLPPARTRPSRTDRLLNGPIVPTLFSLAWPNVLVLTAQSITGLIEVFWLSRLGTDTLAGMALVFPVVMLMQMMSGGAIGGGISSAIARALGGGRRHEADALVLHAVVICVALGGICSAVVLTFGPMLYRALGGSGAALDAALTYSNVVFAGVIALWLLNAFASAIRGTGNMLVPALVICVGVVVLIPLSPCLIFGLGPIPRLGVAGGGVALLLYNICAAAFLGWYVVSGRNGVRFRWVRLEWRLFREILRVGGLSAINSLQTNITVAVSTGLVGAWFGTADVAGYGTGARLEYLLIPLVFGIGSTLVAMVGMNVGAGQLARARKIAFAGAAAAFALTEAIGLAAAAFPAAWLTLFDSNPAMLAAGETYLRAVGPFYGFYGLGFALYFSMQGVGRLALPLGAGFLRMVIATVGGWLALKLGAGELGLYGAVALGLFTYGAGLTIIASRLGTVKRRGLPK